jgi:transcription elongation factor Elf1
MVNSKLAFYLDEAINQLKEERRKKIRYAPKEKLEKAVCPRCGKKANSKEQVKKLFGFRLTGNTVRVQSWCLVCRGL